MFSPVMVYDVALDAMLSDAVVHVDPLVEYSARYPVTDPELIAGAENEMAMLRCPATTDEMRGALGIDDA